MLRPKDLCQGSGTKTFLDAMHSGKVHLARFVLDALDGRIINSKTENSKTPLMFAVSLPDAAARVKFTRLLLEKGADVNCQDDRGRTALSMTCELGYLDVVKLLVQFNADPEIPDAWGNNSLMYAACSGHSQVLEFLIRAFKRLGLKLDRTNQAGHSAAQVANFFGHNQCVQALNSQGKKALDTEEQLVEVSSKEHADIRRPNRLPKQVLERFTKQFHSKCEDHLPAVFQKQLKVGDSNGVRKRTKVQNQSPDRKGPNPPFLNHFNKHFTTKDDQEDQSSTLFTAKQMQNCKLKDLRCSQSQTLEFNTKEDESIDRAVTQQVLQPVPVWGRAKSLNSEQMLFRNQTEQSALPDTLRVKRGSVQDEQSAHMQYQEDACPAAINDLDASGCSASRTRLDHLRQGHCFEQSDGAQTPNPKHSSHASGSPAYSEKRLSLPQCGRPDKLLAQREELPPHKIQASPPAISALGTRLLRRFTAPEFLRLVKDFPSGSDHGRAKISRSETFPLSYAHHRVNHQPSVDSISGVKCEFENNAHVYHV
ncbi:ankyrin repeat domain-containing protein 63 [Amia ocellicauda]|uniref:ankyrin repeat domain-containing protein 63 n=1 Tax=Amia ocellicauda TaxID=2972642 RepID=UPI0034645527